MLKPNFPLDMIHTTTTTSASSTLWDHFKRHKDRPSQKDIPRLNEVLLKRARNSVPRSEDNNDLLEFIGDRCVNLICAIMVEDVKLSTNHHQTVSRRISSNDTFGRISYCLQLHEHAELLPRHRSSVDDWDPNLSEETPPKVLADLFEAYAGAVYEQHGWRRLFHWLERIFKPIIKLATADYWQSSSWDQIYSETTACRWRSIQPDTRTRAENRLFRYIDGNRKFLKDKGREAVFMLPPGTAFLFDAKGDLQTPDCDRVEVAEHLIKLWICQIIVQHWPEYHRAKARAAHMFSGITQLTTSERVMGRLAEAFSLPNLCRPTRDTSRLTLGPYQYASALRATVGWMYRADPATADAWGLATFTSTVMRVHDMFLEEHGYRPIISFDRVTTPAAVATPVPQGDGNDSEEDGDLLSSLVQGLGSLRIQSETKHAPKPITIISITAACSGIGSLTVHTKTATCAVAEERVGAVSLPAPNIANGSKWRPVADSADDSPTCEADPVGMPISLTAPREGEASPRSTENVAEALNPGSWKVVLTSQGSVLPPKAPVCSTKAEPSRTLQAGALIAQLLADKENKTSTDAVDEKTPYAASVTKPTHRGSPVAPESSAHTPVMFVPRSIRVKTETATS